MSTNLLQPGNTKLGKSIYQFSLPPLKTCTPSNWCQKNCYALHGLYKIHEDMINNYFNRCLKASESDTFVLKVCNEIKKHKNLKYIRIHVAGDFYSHEYVEKWQWIAYLNPSIKFLAFTKRDDMKESLAMFAELPNVSIRESLDESIESSLPFPKAIIQGSHADLEGFVCSGHCDGCFACWNSSDNVILPAH